MHLAIFDIDGTLTDSCAFDDALYAQAVKDVLNIRIDSAWVCYKDVTDSGILNEVLDGCGFSGSRAEIHARVRSKFVSALRRYMKQHPVREIPGAKGLIDMLQCHGGIAVALATGGWRESAVLKLQAVGIDPESIPLATASDSCSRCEILEIAASRTGGGRPADRTTYFGDGEWDRKAALELQYDFIGVGAKVAHHTVVPDLADHPAILRHLGVKRP